MTVWLVVSAYFGLLAAGLALDVALVFFWTSRPLEWGLRESRLMARPWGRDDALWLALLLMAMFLAVNAAELLIGGDAEPTVLRVAVQSMLFHGVGLGFVFLSLKRQKLTWRTAFGMDGRRILRDVATGGLFYVAVMPVLWFYALLYQLVLRHAGYESLPQDVVLVFSSSPSWLSRGYMILLAAVLAPLFEEILFRGIALPLLARKWGIGPAVVLLSLVFAAIHFHVASFLPLFLIAVAFCLGYIFSGSLLVPIVMHGLFNTVNLVLLLVLKAV